LLTISSHAVFSTRPRPRPRPRTLAEYAQLAQTIRLSFDTLTNGNPKHYLDTLYTAYEKRAQHGENDIEILERPWGVITRLRDRLDNCGAILRELGTGEDWLVELAKPIIFVIWALDEMICEGLINENELLAAYRTSSLEFQKD
jgi:hypothetical protein